MGRPPATLPSWGRYRQVQATAAASSQTPHRLKDSSLMLAAPSPASSQVPLLVLRIHPVSCTPPSPDIVPNPYILPPTSPNTSHRSSSVQVHLSGKRPGFRPWRDTPTPTAIHTFPTKLSLSSGCLQLQASISTVLYPLITISSLRPSLRT